MKNLKTRNLIMASAIAAALVLAGCGGGSSSSSGGASSASASATPSLGKFSAGTTVNLTQLNGTQLATGSIGSDGSINITLPSYTGAVVLEVLGGSGVTYYDEGLKMSVNFGAGKKLRAVMPSMPSTSQKVGVTLLTEAAVVWLETNVTGGLANATTTDINNANAKVAAVFGLPDILAVPTPVDGSTGRTLDLAVPGDKYALVLAALAKTAAEGKNAADVAAALAADLADDKLDGSGGTGAIYNFAAIGSEYQTAANELATPTSAAIAPSMPLAVNPDVTGVHAATNQPDVALAKAMFAELRTTLNSFSNGNNTGFLDTQAARIDADLSANATPKLEKVAQVLGTLFGSMTMFEDSKAYSSSGNTYGLVQGNNPVTGTPALVRINGDLNRPVYGYGTMEYCWTDSATGVTSKVSCAVADHNSYDWVNQQLKMVVIELTGTTTANQYTYTATGYHMAVSFDQYGNATSGAITVGGLPAGSGSVAKTVSGEFVTGLTLNGTLPPLFNATDTVTTGVETVAISTARTALAAANNYRYSLSGLISAQKLGDSSKVVSFSFDSGSYVDADETNAYGAGNNTGLRFVAAKMIGTAQTVATRFTGTLEMGSVMTDADGRNYIPTSVIFTGSFSDLTSGGAGQFLTGKLEGAMAQYNQYHSTQPDSATNYKHGTVTFTGTIQAPSRPLMKLVAAVTKTGPATSSTTVNYSYGSVSITGSGSHTFNSTGPSPSTLTLSNQDGIQLVFDNTATDRAVVSKSGVTLATINNGMINYVDGVTESLQ
jgi:hypothetical protein